MVAGLTSPKVAIALPALLRSERAELFFGWFAHHFARSSSVCPRMLGSAFNKQRDARHTLHADRARAPIKETQ